ncbi:type II CAAX endopeptidase family protein [Anaerolentibacter hominis]|uniref:type II CAAX endopeptidase family protein n=1 Tax=Anaerolentibacter hominis TaxID=3079009 RepID=UPI0031B7EB33
MKNVWKSDEGYRKNTEQYSKKDGAMALILWGIMLLAYSLLAFLEMKFKAVGDHILLTGCIFNTALIGIAVIVLKWNKQTLNSVGLGGGKWKTSCIMGAILAVIVFMMNCGQYLIQGKRLIPAGEITSLAVYYLLVAVCEELIFRGYIGTRIQGIIKIKWISVCVTGVLFVFMHFPYRIIAYGMSVQAIFTDNAGWLIDLFVIHIIWNFIYRKTNSLYGAIIPHWVSNLAYNIILR